MIPKKIHYCWFGGNPLPELAEKCIASWRQYCPDYEIIRWDENNFDVNSCQYTQEAYGAKKWAFVSDVARLYALTEQGGIYLDTDVELRRSLDTFLSCEAVSGFETESTIMTGLMGCEAGHPLFRQLLDSYTDARFLDDAGKPDVTTNVVRVTQTCLAHGLVTDGRQQTVAGLTVYPKDYFCPKDILTRKLCLTENTHAIHHFDGSWQSPEEQWFGLCRSRLSRVLPMKISGYLARGLAAVKYRGLSGLADRVKGFVQKRIR